MTQNQPDRLDRIEATLDRVAQQLDNLAIAQANTQARIDDLAGRQANTQDQLDMLSDNVNRVLARSAILDDVLLEIRESSERHQRNFEEHQRTTNAALNQLGAILLQLTRIDPQN